MTKPDPPFVVARKMKVIFLLELIAVLSCIILSSTMITLAENKEDSRILVKLPDDIREKTVMIMRDHIHALEDVTHAIQSDDYNKAEQIVESRLNWGSPELIADHDVIKHWPEPMQYMVNQLYLAASNYVAISQNAKAIDSKKNEKDIIAALGEVITTCRNCHETYRLR